MESKNKIQVNVNSEIGKLEYVILHTPGAEVENMTPENAARALYSDILNMNVALPEYQQFHGVLKNSHMFLRCAICWLMCFKTRMLDMSLFGKFVNTNQRMTSAFT